MGQIWHQNQDIDMYDPATDTPMQCNTSTILENLGQVNHLFSDKTGTLTENIMRFRGMRVGGYAWFHDLDPAKWEKTHNSSANSHTHNITLDSSIELQNYPKSPSKDLRGGSTTNKVASEQRTTDLLKHIVEKPTRDYSTKAELFLIAIALCHTCIPEVGEDGNTSFQAASPDEVALVQAAQEMMGLSIDRSTNSITLSLTGSARERYDILDVIEFSTERRRMSVIVRLPDGRICLICKGADSTIIPLLQSKTLAKSKPDNDSIIAPRSQYSLSSAQSQRGDSLDGDTLVDELINEITNDWPSSTDETPFDTIMDEAATFDLCCQHLNDFASEGLRTLLYSHRFLTQQEYKDWKRLYSEATTSLVDRQLGIESVSNLIEQDLHLTGATAIEDKLQAGCAQTIEKLRKANIKIWDAYRRQARDSHQHRSLSRDLQEGLRDHNPEP